MLNGEKQEQLTPFSCEVFTHSLHFLWSSPSLFFKVLCKLNCLVLSTSHFLLTDTLLPLHFTTSTTSLTLPVVPVFLLLFSFLQPTSEGWIWRLHCTPFAFSLSPSLHICLWYTVRVFAGMLMRSAYSVQFWPNLKMFPRAWAHRACPCSLTQCHFMSSIDWDRSVLMQEWDMM